MTTLTIIYLIGVILAYYFGRYVCRVDFSDWSWSAVSVNFILSLFSFAYIVFLLIIWLIIRTTYPSASGRKPPKWL